MSRDQIPGWLTSRIRQYTFCLEIQSINWGNTVFFWPLLLLYFPLTLHSIIGSSVSMSVKHKPLHWYCTLLSENPSFSYNSPLVNQKPVCYFKSKYPVNMTDEEWLHVLEKKSFKFWSSSLPPYVHMVGGKGGCTFATVKGLLLAVIWQFFLCGFNFSCSWRHRIQISQIRVWSARNDATSDNWVLPVMKYPPVQLCIKVGQFGCPKLHKDLRTPVIK